MASWAIPVLQRNCRSAPTLRGSVTCGAGVLPQLPSGSSDNKRQKRKRQDEDFLLLTPADDPEHEAQADGEEENADSPQREKAPPLTNPYTNPQPP